MNCNLEHMESSSLAFIVKEMSKNPSYYYVDKNTQFHIRLLCSYLPLKLYPALISGTAVVCYCCSSL